MDLVKDIVVPFGHQAEDFVCVEITVYRDTMGIKRKSYPSEIFPRKR